MIKLCKEKSLVVANHLRYTERYFGRDLSFRKGTRWISEIDLCLIHEDVLPILNAVEVRKDIKGSDHAPLCISLSATSRSSLLPLLLERAKYLGQSYIGSPKKETLLPKTKPVKEIDTERFKEHMLNHQPPVLPNYDIDTALKTSFNII